MKTNILLRLIAFSIAILLTTDLLNAQSKDMNYITSQTFKDSVCSQMDIQYYDGLGRPLEIIQLNASAPSRHLVMLDEYDGIGREVRKWLPYLTGDSNYISDDIIKSVLPAMYGDNKPYSLNEYDSSPLNRLSEQYGPGMKWQDRLKGIGNEYLVSSSATGMYSCKNYKVENYANDTLMLLRSMEEACTDMFNITKTEGEDNEITLYFTNGRGQNILTRQIVNDIHHDTYYIYDDNGKLRVVLPPIASDSLESIVTQQELVNAVLSKYAYLYQFDARNRCVAKKLPGCEWTYYVYDNADRLIFTQDGNHRSRGEWMFSIPDMEGRVCVTGICRNQLEVWQNPLRNMVFSATRIEGEQPHDSALQASGYTVSGISLSSPFVLALNYYDDYSFLDVPLLSSRKPSLVCGESNPESNPLSSSLPRGLMTGSVYMNLQNDTTVSYNCTVNYYDSFERIVQTQSANHLGGYHISHLSYNLGGELLAEKRTHQVNGSTFEENLLHTYDQRGRLLTTSYQLDDSIPLLLADNEYDGWGRLKRNKRNGRSSLLTEYDYNIRSWVTNLSGPLFRQTIHYNEGVANHRFNGNISSMTWQCGTGQSERGYKFEYDRLNRLTDALYGEGSQISENAGRYNEQITGYDKQGNILGLHRYGQTSATGHGLIDDLTYTLNGNQLQSVDDTSLNAAYGDGFEFKDGAKQSLEYRYDANGNLTQDLNKKITDIQYNCLNLPGRIEFENGSSISYLYASDGTKLRVTHVMDNDTTVTDYCDNVIYENGKAKLLLTEAGYITLSDKKHHFFLQDHQGNNRVVADEEGNVEETNHYYPFGGLMASSSGSSIQNYKYNGKELDRKNGLNWYDYGARHYDAVLGRWHVVDPMAEKYYEISPYAYCLNNPVKFIDPTGMVIELPPGFWASLGKGFSRPFVNFGNAVSHPVETITGIANSVKSATPLEIGLGVSQQILRSSISPFSTAVNQLDVVQAMAYDKVNGTMTSAEVVGNQWGNVTFDAATIAVGAGTGKVTGILGKASSGVNNVKGLGNPFKGKTFIQIDDMFKNKGFTTKGIDPLNGKGSYFNPKTGTKYYLDKGGMYKKGFENPHVDVWYNGHPSFEKTKFFLDDSPKVYVPLK